MGRKENRRRRIRKAGCIVSPLLDTSARTFVLMLTPPLFLKITWELFAATAR